MPVVFRQDGLLLKRRPAARTTSCSLTGGGRDAKVWLEPEIAIADSYGFKPRELSNILKTVAENREFGKPGMSISATSVRFDEHTMWVDLTDGRTLGVHG